MKKLVSIQLLLFLSISTAFGQSSFNLTLKGNWDNETLPVYSGNVYNDVWGFVYDYREYAILGSVGRTHFIDVTDPPFLTEVANFTAGINTIWRDFKTFGHYAYGVADQSSPSNPNNLQIFDYSGLPDTIIKVFDANTYFQTAHNIFIDERNGRFYAAGSDTRPGGLIVLDLISDPASPTLMASVNLPGGYVHDVFVRDNIAYCSHGFNGLYIYDMTNPTTPILLGNLTTYPFQGYNHASWLTDDGNFLVFADESFGRPLRIMDISDLSNLAIISTFQSALQGPTYTNSIAHNPFIRDGYAFVAYYHDGLQVFDIRDVVDPVRVAYYDTYVNTNYSGYDGAWGAYPFLPSHNILVSDQVNGLFVLEFDDLDPKPLPGLGQDIKVVDASEIKAIGNQTGFDPGEIRVSGELGLDISLYPNPIQSDQDLNITLDSPVKTSATAQLFDVNGRLITEHNYELQAGIQDRPILINGVPPGLYTLLLTGEGIYQQEKLVVRE